MNEVLIRAKFGGDYVADENTFTMGIDNLLASHIAARFHDMRVLETCTGGGFTTIALAREAQHVLTVEVDSARQKQARDNVHAAGLADQVTFLEGDILDEDIWDLVSGVDAAFLDPDWAITGPRHVHRFIDSTMRPPADVLLERVLRSIASVALVLPPLLDVRELISLPPHEREKLFLDGRHALYCLYFGRLAGIVGETEFHARHA